MKKILYLISSILIVSGSCLGTDTILKRIMPPIYTGDGPRLPRPGPCPSFLEDCPQPG